MQVWKHKKMGAPLNSAGSLQRKTVSSGKMLPAVPVIQRNSFEDFDTYEEAKNANKYSKALLDEQKDDPIEWHVNKDFDSSQKNDIYKVNKKTYGENKIISDSDGVSILVKSDTKKIAHIDHRFPKSRGGSNHFTNAALITAKTNIQKSNKLELDEEPTVALKPYRMLFGDSAFSEKKVGPFRDFSAEQRKAIIDANDGYYDGVTSDDDGETKLSKIDTTRVPHIDHITPKSEKGTNYAFNAMVLPASKNIQKSGPKGKKLDLDYEIGEMSLVKYYKKKEQGKIFGSAFSKY